MFGWGRPSYRGDRPHLAENDRWRGLGALLSESVGRSDSSLSPSRCLARPCVPAPGPGQTFAAPTPPCPRCALRCLPGARTPPRR